MTAKLLRALLISSIVALGGTVWLGEAGEKLKPGKLSKTEQATLQSGLTLRLFAAPKTGKPLDMRRVRLAALHVDAGAAASPFVPRGPFDAVLSGYLKTSLKGEFTFHLTCMGSATLTINGKDVLEAANATRSTPAPIPLAKGHNRIEVSYSSPKEGDATLRVDWSGEGFTTEPLPPDRLFTRGDEPGLVRGAARREARSLFATRLCARCHELPGGVKDREVAMPELRGMQGPSLAGAGRRFDPAWVARWVQDPRSMRPDARMPKLLHGDASAQQAADLAAYLARVQDGPTLTPTAPTAALLEAGERHFDKLGCMACHSFDDPSKPDSLGRRSLAYANAKYAPGALVAFLKAPHAHYAWTRMPDFRLDAKEATALAAFVRDRAKGKVAAVAQGDAARGAKLFVQVGCANCHATKGTGNDPARPKLRPSPADLAKGCLAETPGSAPDFGWTAHERAVLQAFLATDHQSFTLDSPAEFATRQVQELQCHACHRRDGQTSRWNQLLEDEGLMSEFLPPLTWAGEKLKPAWTAQLLLGKIEHRARPWLKARMPGFPARADVLALGLSHEHGFAASEDDRPAPDPKLAVLGGKLIQQQGGFNCVMCHAVGKQPAVAPFEAPGINLRDAAVRLRHNYYPRWMIDPPHVDITTRMPKFSQDGKTTPIRDILDGDAFRQYEAVWQYIQTLPKQP